MAGRKRKRFHRCSCRECKSRRHPEVAEYHRSINRVMGELDERSRRLFAGLLARQFGRGGRQRVLEITGLSRMTILRGLRECDKSQPVELDRIRCAGGGRKLIEKKPSRQKTAERAAQGLDSGRPYGRSALDAQDNSQSRGSFEPTRSRHQSCNRWSVDARDEVLVADQPQATGENERPRSGSTVSPFVIKAVRSWWMAVGRYKYKGADRLLIECDCGGGNGPRIWAWKVGLQRLADEFGLMITVGHFPPGASKWNLIEHRMFSLISANWAGEPLASYEVVLKYLRTTRSTTGFRCRAKLDKSCYPKKTLVTDEQKAGVQLMPHRVLPKWNYTVRPQKQ